MTLLDEQAADFDRTTAFNVTKTLLTKHGDAIKGVWAANDDMALGALQALEAAGLAGKVAVVGIDAVPEAVQAIADGTMTATVSSDGPWQGGIGLAMGYCALTGELDVSRAQPRSSAPSTPSRRSSPRRTPRTTSSRRSTSPTSSAATSSTASTGR